MGDPRAKAAMKVMCDLITVALIVGSFLLYAFRFMKDYYVLPLGMDFEFVYNDMDAYVHCSFSEFHDHFCSNSTSPVICSDRAHFEVAGIVYTVLSAIVLLLCVYSILHALSFACVCTCWGTLSYGVINYIYPPLYVLAVLLYILITEVFSLTTGEEKGKDYQVKVGPGMALMFLGCVVSVVSVCYYVYARHTGLTAFLDVVQDQDRAEVPAALLPQAKVPN